MTYLSLKSKFSKVKASSKWHWHEVRMFIAYSCPVCGCDYVLALLSLVQCQLSFYLMLLKPCCNMHSFEDSLRHFLCAFRM